MSLQDTRDQLQRLAARLQAALQCREIYPPKHPRLQQAVDELYEELGSMFHDAQPLRLAHASGEFVVGNTQVPVAGEVMVQFGSLLRGLGIEKLIFDQAVSRSELGEMLDILGRDPVSLAAAGGVREMFERSSITHITVGSIQVETGDIQDSNSLFRTWEAYSAGLHIMRGIKSSARRTGEVCDAQEVRQLALDLTALAMQETRPLLAVHALMQHDDYSFTHSLNVAMLTLALAQNLPFKAEELHDITVAALLHDVGKERIPGEILRKPGKLTPEEWDIVNTHGLEGARILSETEGIDDLAPLVAYEHHLAYHEELRDDDWEPHLVSQLVSIADVYDALRSVRPYRGEIPPDEAMHIMEVDAGTKFEPSLFAGFRAMVGLYPPGTVLRLASGRLAVSFASNAHAAELPQVVIARNADGSEADGTERLDLAAPAASDDIAELVAADAVGIEPLDYL